MGTSLNSWWKNLDLLSRLQFTRHRVTEAYLWTVIMYFEPHYSRARLILCKITMILSVVDDMYDSFASLE
ncbi:hypothetical protein LWI28_010467 [Acer negundo]|uniref:Terpene synthase metal-binding domain-containing protein n=1 Tax=Acer negundo TaxID=4023 RepID=A0AAD5IDH4_ACENE|nr:hypothetical protein LWI28_010467 [Acer negundo]